MNRTLILLCVLFFSCVGAECDISGGCAVYHDLIKLLVNGRQKNALSLWKEKYKTDSVAWNKIQDLFDQKQNPESMFSEIVQNECNDYAFIPIYYVYYSYSEEQAKKTLYPFFDIVEKSNCDFQYKRVIILYLDIWDDWNIKDDR